MFNERIKQNIVSQLLVTATILSSGAILNVVQLLLHIFVRPFSKKIFNRLMYYVIWTWLAQCVFIYEYWSDSELVVHCKKEDYEFFGHENNLAIFNHIYEIDWLIAWILINRFRGLGYARGFVKNSIKFIPIWGWFFGLAGHIFLRRSFEKDKELIEDKISEYMTCTDNTWIVLMAEGTRFTKEKYETCLKFAQEKNIVPLKHHLIPRSKGFSTCIPILRKYNCPAVYNVQVSFNKGAENPPFLSSLVLGKKIIAHVYINRIPMENVEPTFEFLYDIFKEKDALQDSFNKYGNFYEGRGLKINDGYNEKPRTCLLVNTLCWVLLELFFILYQAYRMIEADRIQMLVVIGIATISIFYIMLKNMLHLSKVENSSRYGKAQ
ncbi:1-acyl-sn-glycerol-3-phosphate acyltransferase gamma-like [Chironomus tepperi]|uniref:1-acyl-sn-glycerol-3-phosphate acyltransferase gamma-like n=1 Tax=Chironomus tepperi TaxID=113505 RepID=UPI00391FC5DE